MICKFLVGMRYIAAGGNVVNDIILLEFCFMVPSGKGRHRTRASRAMAAPSRGFDNAGTLGHEILRRRSFFWGFSTSCIKVQVRGFWRADSSATKAGFARAFTPIRFDKSCRIHHRVRGA